MAHLGAQRSIYIHTHMDSTHRVSTVARALLPPLYAACQTPSTTGPRADSRVMTSPCALPYLCDNQHKVYDTISTLQPQTSLTPRRNAHLPWCLWAQRLCHKALFPCHDW